MKDWMLEFFRQFVRLIWVIVGLGWAISVMASGGNAIDLRDVVVEMHDVDTGTSNTKNTVPTGAESSHTLEISIRAGLSGETSDDEASLAFISLEKSTLPALSDTGFQNSALPRTLCDISQSADALGPMLLKHDPGFPGFSKSFSFGKTLNHIIDGQLPDAVTTADQRHLIQSFLDVYARRAEVNPISSVSMPVSARATEAALDANEFINAHMKPTAIFNRLDLADPNGNHCGEQRLVYHMEEGPGRLFLIFEAQLPNPEPERGVAGCHAIADFWATQTLLDENEQLERLEQFFYRGLVIRDVEIGPVITFENFQAGQVRANSFVDRPWQLREFRSDKDGNGRVVFSIQAVKDNPLAELYALGKLNNSQLLALQEEFMTTFNDRYRNNLTQPEQQGLTDPAGIINGIFLGGDPRFNEFQSDAAATDSVSRVATANFLDAIAPEGNITETMILHRAESQTCGGCHHTASGKLIAPALTWPDSLGFVHVNEEGTISPALRNPFFAR
jgi:hypothetical protein